MACNEKGSNVFENASSACWSAVRQHVCVCTGRAENRAGEGSRHRLGRENTCAGRRESEGARLQAAWANGKAAGRLHFHALHLGFVSSARVVLRAKWIRLRAH